MSNKVFVLLIPKCSAFSLYLIGFITRVGLTRNTNKPIGLIFRLMLKLTIEASEIASIEDTRLKGWIDGSISTQT